MKMASDPKAQAQAQAAEFGRRLKEARDARGDSLREIQRRTGLNSGYLSQLENGKITYPSPSVLQKVATGYLLRFEDVMNWAGYATDDPEAVTPNQAVALSTVSALGDPTDEELQALRAIVDLLQKNRSSPYSPPSDIPLDAETVAEIRRHALALLREADALGERPTPLEDVQGAARLVLAGEITLDARDRKRLFERFGHWVNSAWNRLQGTFDYRTSAIWLAPDLHAMKRRFVLSHEIGHAILPAHKKTFAFIDDFTCLPPIARDLFEREANQAAVEILFQGGQASDEFDSSPPSLAEICRVASSFGASVISTARFVAERSRRPVAVAIAHRRSGGGFGPTHIYSSQSFETTYGWTGSSLPPQVRASLRTSFSGDPETWIITNRRGDQRVANVEKMFTGYAAITLVVPESKTKKLGRTVRTAAVGAIHLPG
jgi:transcriptional regulator with XRE-family HTH domain